MREVRRLPGDHAVEADRARQVPRDARRAAPRRARRPAFGQDLERAVQERERGQDRRGLAVRHVAGGAPAPGSGVVHAGRSSRIRLAVWIISTAQAAGRTRRGSPRSTSATSSVEDRAQALGRRRRGCPRARPRPPVGAAGSPSGGAAPPPPGDAAPRASPRSPAKAAVTRPWPLRAAYATSARPGLACGHPTAPDGSRVPTSPAAGGSGECDAAPPSSMEDNRAVMDYRDAGVDITAADEAKDRIKTLARGTFNPAVLSEIGSFGGMFRPDLSRLREPVLVASTDGVGTKIKVAIAAGVHDTVGLRPRRALRQRHPGPGRRAALLPRLHRARQDGPGPGGGHRARGSRAPAPSSAAR